ncbi:MAG: DUF952 domain-containing protein [Rhodomicrobium sp.]
MGIKTIYKLMTKPEWDAARAEGVFRGSGADRKDGFIHFSTAAQAQETARKFFSGVEDVILLAVDIEVLENLHTPDAEGAGSTLPGTPLVREGAGSTLPGTPLVREGECKGCPSLRWEAASNGELFPHLYSNLPAAAVTSATEIPLADDDAPIIPHDLPS